MKKFDSFNNNVHFHFKAFQYFPIYTAEYWKLLKLGNIILKLVDITIEKSSGPTTSMPEKIF